MKICELKDIFGRGTKFYLETWNHNEFKMCRFEINDLLFGTVSFANIGLSFQNLRAIGADKIAIDLHDIPIEVYEAWKKYSMLTRSGE